MIKRYISVAFPALAAALIFGGGASADTASRHDAVKALGALNGVALQCKFLDQTRRMKSAVVDTVPKERSYGLAFDQTTNDAFLAMLEAGTPCPGLAGFEARVGERIEAMREAFHDR